MQLSQVMFLVALIGLSEQGLRSLPGAQKKYIGTIVTTGFGDPFNNNGDGGKYLQTVKDEFNLLGAENEFKPYAWMGSKNPNSRDPADAIVNTANMDKIVAFAKVNNQRLRGHVLVYTQATPSWLTGGNYTDVQIENMLFQYVTFMVRRFKGQIGYWDVINEIFDGSGKVIHDYWYTHLGKTDTYFGKIFQWAHNEDPNAVLFLNDYGNEELNTKSTGMLNLVKQMKASGIPIHGIGMQSHFSTDHPPNFTNIKLHAEALYSAGLKFQVTELDVWTHKDRPNYDVQKLVYSDTMKLCLAEPNCQAVFMWGFTDKYSWLDNFQKANNGGYGLIFDANYNKKSAYQALQDALA